MAAVVALQVGLVGLSMIPFLLGMGKDAPAPQLTTIVRIGAGISVDGNRDTVMMGSVPGVALFDVGGNNIGQSNIDDSHIHTWRDITIESDDSILDTVPEYISLSAGKDAICVAWVTVTISSGLKYAWVGDIAKACGVPSYYTPVSHDPQSNGYSPYCVWLNGDPNAKGRVQELDGVALQFRGMGLHITDFSTPADVSKIAPSISSNQSTAYGLNHDLFCKSQPRFWMYDRLVPDDYIPYFVGGLRYVDGVDADANKILDPTKWATVPRPDRVIADNLDGENTKRDLPYHDYQHNTSRILNSTQMRLGPHYRERVVRENITEMNLRSSYINANIMKGHLITSNATTHSASELCNDPSSAGPDFVSHFEQMYCDMGTKTVYPLCIDLKQVGCFDLDGTVLRPGVQGKRDVDQVDKSYVKVIDW